MKCKMYKPLIIIGAGGQGKVVLDTALKAGFTVIGFLEDDINKCNVLGYNCLGTISKIYYFSDDNLFVCAIGENSIRMKLDALKQIEWATIVHPSSIISIDVQIGCGSVVMAGSVINASASIGRHCIINTNAVIEHDCVISDYAHISPSSVLCGGVNIGNQVWIGAGAIIKNCISICSETIIGAGAVVVKNINESGVYLGIPARRIK